MDSGLAPSLSSGAHSRDPLARLGMTITCAKPPHSFAALLQRINSPASAP